MRPVSLRNFVYQVRLHFRSLIGLPESKQADKVATWAQSEEADLWTGREELQSHLYTYGCQNAHISKWFSLKDVSSYCWSHL